MHRAGARNSQAEDEAFHAHATNQRGQEGSIKEGRMVARGVAMLMKKGAGLLQRADGRDEEQRRRPHGEVEPRAGRAQADFNIV